MAVSSRDPYREVFLLGPHRKRGILLRLAAKLIVFGLKRLSIKQIPTLSVIGSLNRLIITQSLFLTALQPTKFFTCQISLSLLPTNSLTFPTTSCTAEFLTGPTKSLKTSLTVFEIFASITLSVNIATRSTICPPFHRQPQAHQV